VNWFEEKGKEDFMKIRNTQNLDKMQQTAPFIQTLSV